MCIERESHVAHRYTSLHTATHRQPTQSYAEKRRCRSRAYAQTIQEVPGCFLGTKSLAEILELASSCRQLAIYFPLAAALIKHLSDGGHIALKLGDQVGVLGHELVAPARLNLIDGAGLEVAVDARGVDRDDALFRVHGERRARHFEAGKWRNKDLVFARKLRHERERAPAVDRAHGEFKQDGQTFLGVDVVDRHVLRALTETHTQEAMMVIRWRRDARRVPQKEEGDADEGGAEEGDAEEVDTHA